MDETLMNYREQINVIDAQLLDLLQERFVLSEQIGLYKKEHQLPVFDSSREEEMQLKRSQKLMNNPHKQYIEAVWLALLVESKAQQQAL